MWNFLFSLFIFHVAKKSDKAHCSSHNALIVPETGHCSLNDRPMHLILATNYNAIRDIAINIINDFLKSILPSWDRRDSFRVLLSFHIFICTSSACYRWQMVWDVRVRCCKKALLLILKINRSCICRLLMLLGESVLV